MKATRRLLPLVLLLLTLGCDRATKYLAAVHLEGAAPRSYFHNAVRLEYAENTGAFLSLGANLPDGIRTALLVVGVSLLLIVVAFLAIRRRWTGVPLAGVALMWAGGASNLMDRVANGSVVDFLNVGLGSLRTGIFNVADIAVMLGAILIVVGDFWPRPGIPGTVRNSSSVP